MQEKHPAAGRAVTCSACAGSCGLLSPASECQGCWTGTEVGVFERFSKAGPSVKKQGGSGDGAGSDRGAQRGAKPQHNSSGPALSSVPLSTP